MRMRNKMKTMKLIILPLIFTFIISCNVSDTKYDSNNEILGNWSLIRTEYFIEDTDSILKTNTNPTNCQKIYSINDSLLINNIITIEQCSLYIDSLDSLTFYPCTTFTHNYYGKYSRKSFNIWQSHFDAEHSNYRNIKLISPDTIEIYDPYTYMGFVAENCLLRFVCVKINELPDWNSDPFFWYNIE